MIFENLSLLYFRKYRNVNITIIQDHYGYHQIPYLYNNTVTFCTEKKSEKQNMQMWMSNNPKQQHNLKKEQRGQGFQLLSI